MSDFGWFSARDIICMFPQPIQKEKNVQYVGVCENCGKQDVLQNTTTGIDICLACYHDLPIV